MQKLTTADIKDLPEYELERVEFRSRIIEMKRRRRISVGSLMTMVFENTETMRFQVQEVARAERMLHDEQIAREVETFNELIPGDGELSGTLFVDTADRVLLRELLPRLRGIERAMRIEVGAECVCVLQQEDRLVEEEITATVHYLKFRFTPDQQVTFASGPVRIVIDHRAYQTSTELSPEQRAELARDFAG
jgi:hypothetical protein